MRLKYLSKEIDGHLSVSLMLYVAKRIDYVICSIFIRSIVLVLLIRCVRFMVIIVNSILL